MFIFALVPSKCLLRVSSCQDTKCDFHISALHNTKRRRPLFLPVNQGRRWANRSARQWKEPRSSYSPPPRRPDLLSLSPVPATWRSGRHGVNSPSQSPRPLSQLSIKTSRDLLNKKPGAQGNWSSAWLAYKELSCMACKAVPSSINPILHYLICLKKILVYICVRGYTHCDAFRFNNPVDVNNPIDLQYLPLRCIPIQCQALEKCYGKETHDQYPLICTPNLQTAVVCET